MGESQIPETESLSDLEEELVQGFIRNFHNSLQQCISLILKGLRTPFNSLKTILARSVDNIRDVGGDERAKIFEQTVVGFEKDINVWRELTQADLSPLIAEEVNRLVSKMQEARNEAQSRVVELSQSLEAVKVQKGEVSADFDVALTRVKAIANDISNAHGTIEKANKMIEKAREMISKAEAVLEKSIPLHEADTIYLGGLDSEKIVLREEEVRISQELAAA
jgi:archaellum component FlaC